MRRSLLPGLALLCACGCALTVGDVCEAVRDNVILPEQRTIDFHDPAQLPSVPLPDDPPPRTVSDLQPETVDWPLSLNEAIRIALINAKVVRVLAGTTAAPSGVTIYDPAIANTTIDQAQARFDPVLTQTDLWSRTNTPGTTLDPFDPTRSLLTSQPVDAFHSVVGLNKTNVLGGQWQLNWTADRTRFPGAVGFPLNPETNQNLVLSYTQPLLQGGGYAVNMAPVVIARINTEQSYFAYKDGVQELVRGVIEGYWNLVQARTAAWAAGIQVEQAEFALRIAEDKAATEVAAKADAYQAQTSYKQFVANRIAADANVLTREAALRNLLYLPPNDGRRIVPVSAPTFARVKPDWDALVRLAEQRRPDVVELKLVNEADRVRLVQAQDQTLPKLDAVALYRWNGISGEMPNGEHLSSRAGEFTDWSVGVNFSVPLGLRQGRALVRQQELLLARDRANVEQSVHAAVHDLASTVREMDSSYAQYLAFKEVRAVADANVRFIYIKLKVGGLGKDVNFNYLNTLQAITDWGNAVSSEAQQLLAYNVALATLERQTGTILETHGLVFYEERWRAAGPIPLPRCDPYYPTALPPAGEPRRYPGTGKPSEDAFDLKRPVERDAPPPEKLPPPRPGP
jgi:outer membrane protein TolC